MRVARPVHERLARADAVAFLNVHVHAARQRVLARLGALVGDHENLAQALDDAAVAHGAVDFRDDGRLARLARFEQLDHARQTARDVLGLRRLARNLREHVAGGAPHRCWPPSSARSTACGTCAAPCRRRATISIAGCFFSSGESTMMSRDRPVISSTSSWTVTLSMMSLKRTDAAGFGEDRERVRIPLDEDLALLDVLAVAHLEARAVDDRVALADDALVVHDVDRPAAVHDDERLAASASFCSRPSTAEQAVEPDRALVPRLERGLLGDARRRAADVERPHRQLRAGLANRLRRDDADRQTRARPAVRSPGRGRSTSRTRRGAPRTSAPSGS